MISLNHFSQMKKATIINLVQLTTNQYKIEAMIKALVLCFPAFTLVDDAKAAYASIDEVPDTVEVMGFTIGRTYYEGLFDLDVLAEASKYKGDVLILHGTADNIAPYSYSEAAVEAYENASLIPIEGAGHGFRDKHLDEAMVSITEFIVAHTK